MKKFLQKRNVYVRGYDAPVKTPPRRDRPQPRRPHRWLILLFVALALGLAWLLLSGSQVVQRQSTVTQNKSLNKQAASSTGKVVEQGEVVSYTSEQTLQLIRQTNKTYTGPATPVKTQTFRYTMNDTNGQTVQVYARVFIPATGATNNLPVFAFAPGTTGIDDQCAASVEQSSKRAWGNYPSHMAAYAAQGYATVITDYEGMRDQTRMHHYMVGALEGRAVLDSVRALKNLPLTKDRASTEQVILGGYSQGGHAAYWADEISATYAPEIKIQGVIGFGPVTDVRRTLTDTTQGANILWFGPYVLYSYSDWYKESYPVDRILMPPFSTNLASDISKNCIDTNIAYWGNRDIAKVYTPEFIAAMKTGSVASVSKVFDQRMQENLTADTKTPSKKAIYHGQLDNVVLPAQSDDAVRRLCRLGNEVTSKRYADATHYTTMTKSYNDTINWMKAVWTETQLPNDCR
jgi:predicted esterase